MHYATSWKVPESIPGYVTGDILVAFENSMFPVSIQPLKMSTKIFLWVQTAGV
jgi:hypothetical protein